MTDRNTAIYEAAKSGMPQSEIAKQFGLTQPRICQIVRKAKAAEIVAATPAQEIPVEHS
jgi:DNA-binding transcriptional regulator LsrR (DeoR family)